MIKRYLVAIGGLLAIVIGLAAIKFSQISNLISAAGAAQKAGPPPEIVGSAQAKQENWNVTLNAVGSVSAAEAVTLSNDASGIVTRIYFESGDRVRKGQILVELDHSVERAQLASAKARRQLAELTAQRSRTLSSSGSVAQAEVDNDEAAVRTSNADQGVLDAQIARKVVRAPFSGRLGIRQINLGQYLNPGTPVAVLEGSETLFVDFSLPQQRLQDLTIGTAVKASLPGSNEPPFDGSISAIDPAVDSSTRSIKVRATIPGKGGKLLPGMFTQVSVVLPRDEAAVVMPATAVVHASYGDSVFIVEDKKSEGGAPAPAGGPPVKSARQQFVRLGDTRGDFVAVTEGVKPGQEVVTAGAFKLRNGSPVIIDNTVKPTPQLAPHPENH